MKFGCTLEHIPELKSMKRQHEYMICKYNASSITQQPGTELERKFLID